MPAFKDPVTGASYQVSDDEAGQLSPAPAPQQVGIPFSDPVSGDQYHITPDEAAMLSQVAPKDSMGSMGGTAPGPTDDVDHPIARGLGYGGASLTEILPLALAGVARLPDLAAQGIENIAPKKLADWLKSVHAETAAEDAVFKYGVDPLEHAKEALQPKANEDWGFWKKVEFGAGAAVPTLLSLYATKGASAPESLGPLAGFLLHGSAAGLQMAVPQTASEAATQAAQGDKGSDIAKSAAKNFAINYAMGLVPGSVPEAWLAKAFPASTAARAAARAGSGAVLGAGIQGGSDVLSGQEVDPADLTLGALLGGGVSVLHPMLSGDGMKAGEAEGVMAAAAQAKEAGLDAETIAAIMGKNRGDAAATIAELNTHANAAQATQPAPAPDEFVDSQEAAERVGTPMDREILMARQAGVPDAMIRHVLEGFPGRDIAAIRAVRSLREAVSEGFQGSPEGEIQVGEAELPPTQELAGTPEEAFQDALAEHAQAPTTEGIEVQEHPGNIQEMTSGQEAPTVNDGLPDEPSTKGIKVQEIPGQEVGAVPGTEIPEATAAQAAEAENLARFDKDVPRGASTQDTDLTGKQSSVNVKLPLLDALHGDLLNLRKQSPEAQSAVLQGLPRRIHEFLATKPPAERLGPLEAELQGLRQGVLIAGKARETALSAVRKYRESNAPSGLSAAADGGVAVPEVPSSDTPAAGPGLQPKGAELRATAGEESTPAVERRAAESKPRAQVFEPDERDRHIESLKAENEKLRNLTQRDPATGMRNRRAFDEDAKLGWHGVVATDADTVKYVNDNLGHENGDRLIKAMADLHGQHESEHVRAYRTGGDEFKLRTDLGPDEAEALGKRLQEHAKKTRLTLTGNDPTTGEKRTFQYDGLGLTYGVGHHADEITRNTTADARLNRSKLEREATGERAARGEPPATLVREPAQAEQPPPDSGRAEAVAPEAEPVAVTEPAAAEEPAPQPATAEPLTKTGHIVGHTYYSKYWRAPYRITGTNEHGDVHTVWAKNHQNGLVKESTHSTARGDDPDITAGEGNKFQRAAAAMFDADREAQAEQAQKAAGGARKSIADRTSEPDAEEDGAEHHVERTLARQGLAEGQPSLDTGKPPVFARTEGDSLLRSDQGESPFRGDRPEAYVSPRVAEGAVSGMDVGRMFPGTDRIRSHDDVERMLEPLPDSKDRAGIVIADDLNRPIAVLHHGVDDPVFQLQDAISQMDGAARFWTTENQNPELIQALQDSLGMEHQPDGTVADPSDRSDVMEEIGSQLPQGVHVDDLRQAVETVLKKYNPGPNSPRVQSVQDISEVPARLARDAMASRTDHLVQAIYDPVDDKIWAVGNGFESADDVEAKLFHESLHMGLRRYFGTELDPFLKRVGFTYGKAGLVDIARKYGLDLNTDYGMRVAAEEKLAQLAETMEKPDLWSSFVTFAKQWLNRRGFGFELNERDLRNTVASIANRTLKGDLPAVPFRSDNRIRYSMRPAQMDADLKAISDRVMAPPEDSKTLGQTIREKLLRIKNTDMTSVKQGLLDGAAGLEKLERGLTGGELLDANSSAYKSYYATKNLASVMGHVMVQGVPEYRDGTFQPVAGRKGMVDIFRPIVEHKDGNLLRQWELYAAANRAKRLITEKNPDGTSREKLFTQADIDKVMQLGKKYPEFQKAVDDYQEFNGQLLDLVQDRGVLNGDERKMWERNDYVPMYRAMDDMAQGAGQGPKNKRGVSGQRSGIRRLEGSEEKMGSVLENITLNTAHLLDAAYKNEAMRRIVDLGDGVALHKVNMAWKPTDISHAQMIQALNEAGMEVKHFTPELEKQWATVFRRVAPVGPNIVSVMREGKPDYYEASDPLLYRTITSMGAQQHGTLMNIFRFSKHMLTASITADPGFMVRNFMRDTVNTLLVSDAKIKPLSDAIKNFGAAMKNDPDLMRMMAAGYGGGGFYDTNPKQARKILDRALGEKKGGGIIGKVTSPKQLWWAYQRIGNASEMANRLSVYKAVVANGGTHAEAAYQANDLLNFAKSGDYGAMQFITQTVPFLNARIQGTYKVVQGARAHPLGFALKAATMIGATMALAAYNQQKPEYEDLPDYDKDTYWHFYVGGDHFRIPKPFEIGAMFGTVPERMMRVMEGRDDSRELAQRMAFMVASTFSLNPVPQALNPLLMQYANRNGFGGTPIVPYSMTDMDPKAQYTAATSPTMRTVAGVMPDAAPDWLKSPVRLQAALEAYTGTLGGYALGVADMATREIGGFPVAPSRRLDEEPIVSSFVRDPVMHNTHSLEAFYDALEQSNEAYGAMMKYQKEANLEAAQTELKDHPTAIAVHSALTSLERDIAALDNQMRMVYANTSMTGDQKKASLDQLTLSRNAIASQAMVYTQALSEHP